MRGTRGVGAAAATQAVKRKLSEWLGGAEVEPSAEWADFIVGTKTARFVVGFKASSQASSVASAIDRIKRWKLHKRDLPLLVVPYMGAVGRQLCAQAELSWLDLSGNAEIRHQGLIIHSEGHPNQFRSVGRPESTFSPAASRVTRWLLAHPNEPMSQREIARDTSLDEGFVSRIVRRLVEQELAVRVNRKVSVRDPSLLLTAWTEVYDFSQHTVFRAHGVSRNSDELCSALSKGLSSLGYRNAATGLAAAWLTTRFAGFRLVTFFVEKLPDDRSLKQLQLRPVERGENVWLVVPNDAGVFMPVVAIDGIPCVHPAQIFVDLKAHPERATEAADSVLSYYLQETHEHQA